MLAHGRAPIVFRREGTVRGNPDRPRREEEQLVLLEKQLEAAEETVAEKTQNHELAPYVMSIPGVGIGIAAVLIAYLGDGKRFSKPREVAAYAGFAPRVDCSGIDPDTLKKKLRYYKVKEWEPAA